MPPRQPPRIRLRSASPAPPLPLAPHLLKRHPHRLRRRSPGTLPHPQPLAIGLRAESLLPSPKTQKTQKFKTLKPLTLQSQPRWDTFSYTHARNFFPATAPFWHPPPQPLQYPAITYCERIGAHPATIAPSPPLFMKGPLFIMKNSPRPTPRVLRRRQHGHRIRVETRRIRVKGGSHLRLPRNRPQPPRCRPLHQARRRFREFHR